MGLALAALVVLTGAPASGSCEGATGAAVTFTDYARGAAAFDEVKVGWAARRLRRRLGAPDRCAGDVWSYSAGRANGPITHLEVTVRDGRVTKVERSGAGCVLNE